MSAAAGTKSSNDSAPESDESVSKATKPAHARPAAVEDTSADETRTARSAPPKPLGDKDPLIIQAENYIQGRRVRQNCSQGVNLLREAVGQGNPAADVKMGALYWSGTCVTQSKVTAYQWFTRAHEKEPRNIWIERSRNSLWASMSSQEKRRVAD
jgi:TPR repeat protein